MEQDLTIRTRSTAGVARDNRSVGGFDFLIAGGPHYNRNAEALRVRTTAARVRPVAGELATWRCCSPAGLFLVLFVFTAKRLYSTAQGRPALLRRTLGYRANLPRNAEGVSQTRDGQ